MFTPITIARFAFVCCAVASMFGDVNPVVEAPHPPRWVSGYYVGYQRALYPEETLDFSNLTHIIVGRIVPAPHGGVIANFDIDDARGPAMAAAVASRAHKAGRAAILMLGGSGTREAFIEAASDANRATFVANLLATMDRLGYDGIDVDWEPLRSTDAAPALELLRALRRARPAMLLTMPVAWADANAPLSVGSWYHTAAALLDQVNVMTYAMAGPWSGWESWHSSALTDHAAAHPSSVESSIRAYLNAGVPAAKLGVGVGSFGACWRGITAPRQSLARASWIAGDNTMSYATIMSSYYAANARRWDDRAKAPYLTFAAPAGPAGCTFISFEDEQSIAEKGMLVDRLGLGGAIVWTIGEGHVGAAQGNARAGGSDPLLRATYRAILKR